MNVKQTLAGRRASVKETEAAFAKFATLTERQQAIVYDRLLWCDIAERWSTMQLASEYYLHGGYVSPLSFGPHAADAVNVLVNAWTRDKERNAFRKSDTDIATDRERLEKRRAAAEVQS